MRPLRALQNAIKMIGGAAAQVAGSKAASHPRRPRLALLCNIIAPYRLPIYEALGRAFDLDVIHNGAENRDYWAGVQMEQRTFRVRRARGFTLKWQRKVGGQNFDTSFLHVPIGALVDLARIKPDAVIANEMGFRSLVALTYGTLMRVPVWIWWGGTLHTEAKIGRTKARLRQWFVRNVERWISYGDTSTEYLTSIGVERTKILQIQNCVDETAFVAPAEPALKLEPKPVLLYVGQLIGRKGVDALIRAAGRAQLKGHRFSLALVGSGAEKARLEDLARQIRLSSVHFIPAQPPGRMPAIYRSADLLVFPTFEDVWGLVVNEAMWSGLPVLCSKYAGCAPEIVPAEQIFDPGNPDDFSRVLEAAIESPPAPPDVSRLRTAGDVAELIATDIDRALGRAEASQGRRSRDAAS